MIVCFSVSIFAWVSVFRFLFLLGCLFVCVSIYLIVCFLCIFLIASLLWRVCPCFPDILISFWCCYEMLTIHLPKRNCWTCEYRTQTEKLGKLRKPLHFLYLMFNLYGHVKANILSIEEDVEDVRINVAHNKANQTRITDQMKLSRSTRSGL